MKLFIFSLALFGLRAEATTYTVKAGGGGNYTTISACAAAAQAGDTCSIFAGSYAGWTQPNSGSSGLPITFTANAGDTVTVTSGIDLSSRSYITISYLHLQGMITGDGSSTHNTITHCTDTTTLFRILYALGSGGTDNIISYNTITFPDHNSNPIGIEVFGDRTLIEHNEISGSGGDCFWLGGINVVVRSNYCHDRDGSISGEHLDFVQVPGGAIPTLAFSLVEGNVNTNCLNDATNCHFMQVRAQGAVADTLITRYNYDYNVDGSFAFYGNHLDGTNTVPNGAVYNNTAASGLESAENGDGVTFDAGVGYAYNNIFYNFANGTRSPTYYTNGGGGNGNLAYTAGYSGAWGSPYSTETTYSALHNQDPLFANYPTDGTLSARSPAIAAGSALTAVAAGDSGSGTSLVVNNAHCFQPGWAGTQADWIRVGDSTTVQIAAIDYSTNTITLANSITRSSGNPVYLYKDSNGKVVLFGKSPDIGAYPYGLTPGLTPPANLTAVSH